MTRTRTLAAVSLAGLLAVASLGGLGGCASQKTMLKAQQEGEGLRTDLAETYIAKGAYDAAIPLLSRAVLEQPNDPHVHMLYATVLRERGLYPQSQREFLTALRLAPNYPSAWAGIGVLYDLMREPVKARAAHEKAIALAPKNAAFWNNLGFSYYLAGDYDAAVTALEQALALDPGLVLAYNNLGFAYARRGDYDDARRCFTTAGGEGPALVNLALAYEENGDAVTAARLRADAGQIDPNLEVR